MEPVELWNALSESGNFSITGGELVFDETIALDEDQSSMLSIIIELINNEIKLGYLIANDSDNGILLRRSELTADVEVSLTSQNESMTSTQALTEKSGSHSCSYEQVYFNDMCRTNYNYIKNILNQYTSWNSGYIAAISAWIAKVNNNGDWDYKTSSYYGPWDHVFCNISDGQYDHVTSEYMGNYNYGYTGSCLFSLQTLELASFIVSGFDNSDIAGDWSTIESAFYTARAEQINVCPTNRWVYSYGRWYYFNSYGNPYVGWHEIEGCWYSFNSAGVMQTGWQQIDGCWYYLNSSGVMQTGWQQIDGYWYYLNSSGVMQTGWQQVDNYWYYLNSSGAMQTGWVTSGNSKYYMETSGAWSGWLIYGGTIITECQPQVQCILIYGSITTAIGIA